MPKWTAAQYLLTAILLLLGASCKPGGSPEHVVLDFRQDFDPERVGWPKTMTSDNWPRSGDFDLELYLPSGRHTRVNAYFVALTRKGIDISEITVHFAGRETIDEVYDSAKKALQDWGFQPDQFARLDAWHALMKPRTGVRTGIDFVGPVELGIELGNALPQGDDRTWGIFTLIDTSRPLLPPPDAPLEMVTWDFRKEISPESVHWPAREAGNEFQRNANTDLEIFWPTGQHFHIHCYLLITTRTGDKLLAAAGETTNQLTLNEAHDLGQEILRQFSPEAVQKIDAWRDALQSQGPAEGTGRFDFDDGMLTFTIGRRTPDRALKDPRFMLEVILNTTTRAQLKR